MTKYEYVSRVFFPVYGRLPQHLVLALKNLGKRIRDYHASMLQGHSSLLWVPLKKLPTIADNDLPQLRIRCGTQTSCSHHFCLHLVIDTKMAANSLKLSLPSLPDELKPHHPKNFEFPKRTFGSSKPVLCSAQSQWFS